MSNPTWNDVVFATGGDVLQRFGVPWLRRGWSKGEPEAPTFTRADSTTCATYVDRGGAIRRAAAGKLRTSWTYNSGTSDFDIPGLLLESSRVNVCLQSEDFGTTWSAVGSPTRSAGAGSIGVVSYDLIGDDSAAAPEGYSQDITFTGDAVKAVSVFIGQGTATKMFIRLADETAPAERLGVNLTWSGGVVSAVATVGVVLGTVRLSNGFRVLMQTAAITAANTNRLIMYPGSDSSLSNADVGNVYVGGVQCENAPYPSSYIKTTTGAVTRAADALTFPIGFEPQDLTMYFKVVRPAYADASTATDPPWFFILGTGGACEAFVFMSTNTVQAIIDNGSSTTPVASQTSSSGDIEGAAQFVNYSSAAKTRLDIGAGFSAYSSTAGGTVTNWGTTTATVGFRTPGLVSVIIAKGSFTLAEMQTLL